MIRSFLILAAVLAPVTALAQSPKPALRAVVTVTGDIVTVGDLLDGAVVQADTPLFHAPEPGGTGTIQAWRVLDALRAHALEAEARGVAEVRVERRARLVSDIELQQIVATDLLRRLNLADRQRLDLRLDNPPSMLTFEAPETAAVTVERVVHDPATGRFELTLGVPESRRARPVRITGTAVEQVDVIRLRRTINRGETVNASDLAVERAPRHRLPSDVATGPGDVIGMSARRTLVEGVFIRTADVERPRVIARNDQVTIVLEAGSLVVTARGRAQDGGAVGDVIDVQNTSSRRVIQATVVGPGKVSVRLGGQRRVATNDTNVTR